ncbi:putative pilus biogenesis operon protein [Corallococcus coralloides]|uniref:Putative pilus biogenesis operon protein n=1 Tax=Corallococcus coralloides TaxID=184914 RepID=A0A410RL24_CORCK|nr:DUF4114 domain-containing protein [Corallococcus coralloides]QAT82563.1 putative pilus biogenesis operon protein [Corallococcus coralloides]
MRTLFQRTLTALALTVATPSLTTAQQLCQDDLANDKQGDFQLGPNGLTVANNTIILRDDGRLQLNTNLKKLDSENITFPFDQTVTIDYVYESAGASHSLGYLYMDDVIARGYADPVTHELVDKNNNGILDLHEAIYNLTPDDDTVLPIKYVGTTRRCTRAFTSGGKKYMEPDLAMKGDCSKTFVHKTDVTDSRPVRADSSFYNIENDWIGSNEINGTGGDKGLFPYIPNLLEPASPDNNNLGIGRMVFLLVDDDSDKSVHRNIGPVADVTDTYDGVPDYNVSQYDFRGIKLPAPPVGDPEYTNYQQINTGDRRVNLGLVQGGKEIVFFAVVYYDARHNTDNDTVAPCLKRKPYTGDEAEDGKCLLHLQTAVSVFFSKATWNLDQNFKAPADNKVAERNIGCSYEESCTSPTSATACTIEGTSNKACGWLEQDTLNRLDTAAYKNLKMPKEGVTVMRPGTEPGNPQVAIDRMNYMPHVIVGAPSTDPFRWILGFEDLNGGGDRDFNDIVFMINKENGGGAKSTTITSDVMGDTGDKLGPNFTITKVRFRRQDDVAPYATPGNPPKDIRPNSGCTKAPCWTEEVPGACTASGVKPTITYSIAVDCRVLDGAGKYQKNENPTWVPVPLDNNKQYPDQEVEIDILALGLTGSQLCWKVDISSPSELCRPIIDDIDIGYQAVRSGAYARSSPSTIGNVAVWGVNETPGQNWGAGWNAEGTLPSPGNRAYDGGKDYGIRGRLYLQSLYNPENPKATEPKLRWEAGRVMALSLAASNPLNRKLYTMNSAGDRLDVKHADMGNTLMPASLCNTYSEIDGRYLYDLNRDGVCTVAASTSPYSDRQFLVDWLYGYEDANAALAANKFRPWPFGGINISTVALAVPPYADPWYQNAKPAERDLFRTNFLEPLKTRSTRAFVGTMSGVLHSFESGAFRNDVDDPCTPGNSQFRGYFAASSCPSNGSPALRDYGSGEESFAYMPNLLLSQYRNQYVRFRGSGTLPKPQMDASPSIANMDFGDRDNWDASTKYTWKPETTAKKKRGAKTVLVSASGKASPVVFAMDITNPNDSWYPLPLWEFSLADTDVASAFTSAIGADNTVLMPDNSGSRHSPALGRISWGSSAEEDRRWVAVVGTDYDPGDLRAGAVYLLDMKTGKPLTYGGGAAGRYAGVLTFEQGSGIAAETPLVDLDQDGSYDVMYVPTTAGSVWRVNFKDVATSGRKLGGQVKKCMVAHAASALKNRPDANQTELDLQELYSNIAVKVVSKDSGPAVRFYFGTSDSPDKYTDGYPEPDPKNPTYQYHLLAFEDPDPSGSKPCAELTPLWVQKLAPGQKLWGGVALSAESVYAATAVGTAADICSLDADAHGEAYTASQASGVLMGGGSKALTGHAISSPVVHDEHLFVLTATGEMQVTGDPESWNNKAGTSGSSRSQIMLWEPLPDGRLPQ